MESRTPTDFDSDLDAIEAHLAGTLKPVSPPGDLIQRLRERIRLPAREEIVLRFQDWRRLFLIFGGVMSGMLLLITVARAFFHLARKQI
ncbi:MAG: hypothetical protein DCC56_10995 [Anaerolineae bacterium]|nr:hypothetical protein [Anaerolineales bacterium]RIK29897.1 MAG: hypothetical protein DCC56_10995 [Anaerolineae bacterium]WKZ45709.1 MAG: hypothetical protein QY302_07940 [Anaerolineales bacterium]WKZ48355.1 MAG: hypothetical protein QY306_03170 [Anaerolineales bacterium]